MKGGLASRLKNAVKSKLALGLGIGFLSGFLLSNYLNSRKMEEVKQPPKPAFKVSKLEGFTKSSKQKYKVKKGDNLWKVAKKTTESKSDKLIFHYWRELINENKQIKNPDLIFPGDTVTLPALYEDRVERIAKGTPYETEIMFKQGFKPGGTSLVLGGIHGDEPSGYIIAHKLADSKMIQGKMIVIPEVNKQAVKRRRRKYERTDFNRTFLSTKPEENKHPIAKEVVNVIKKYKPDVLLNLHENMKCGGYAIFYDSKRMDGTVSEVLSEINKKGMNFRTNSKPMQTTATYIAEKMGCDAYGLEVPKRGSRIPRKNGMETVTKKFLEKYKVRAYSK